MDVFADHRSITPILPANHLKPSSAGIPNTQLNNYSSELHLQSVCNSPVFFGDDTEPKVRAPTNPNFSDLPVAEIF